MMADPSRKLSGSVRRRVEFEGETWHALTQLAHETGRTLQELTAEAFGALLKKRHRPATLRDALRQSTRLLPANDAKPVRYQRRR
jgi:hypothetical protein